jgi:hypothetical protein
MLPSVARSDAILDLTEMQFLLMTSRVVMDR